LSTHRKPRFIDLAIAQLPYAVGTGLSPRPVVWNLESREVWSAQSLQRPLGPTAGLATKGPTMIASDIQIEIPLVKRTTSALVAARLIAKKHLAGLVVTDEAGAPVAIVSSSDVLRLMIPTYVMDDVALSSVFDEKGAEEMWAHVNEHTVGELFDNRKVNVRDVLHVPHDATLVEVAAKMVDAHVQIAVVDGAADEPRFITLPAVMDAILTFCTDAAAKA
jgi:CBS domain-containing protein